MSPHDFLSTEIRRVRALLTEYVEEFDPPHADEALGHATRLLMVVESFTTEEDRDSRKGETAERQNQGETK